MSRNTRKHLSGIVQPEFGFAEQVAEIKAVAIKLMRFDRDGEFNRGIDYGAWLAFYAGLNSRGVNVNAVN